MVPDIADIAAFAPVIRSVFGQYRRTDPRFISFDIADLRNSPTSTLVGSRMVQTSTRCRSSSKATRHF